MAGKGRGGLISSLETFSDPSGQNMTAPSIALVMVCVMKVVFVCVLMTGLVLDVKPLAVPTVALATAPALLAIVFVAMVT